MLTAGNSGSTRRRKKPAPQELCGRNHCFCQCVIDAKERRNVMKCDVPGAFMQVDIDEKVHLRLTGTLAELLVEVDKELYSKYLTKEKGKTVMYLQLKKANYFCQLPIFAYFFLTIVFLFFCQLCNWFPVNAERSISVN